MGVVLEAEVLSKAPFRSVGFTLTSVGMWWVVDFLIFLLPFIPSTRSWKQ